jgi:hypothetical protein
MLVKEDAIAEKNILLSLHLHIGRCKGEGLKNKWKDRAVATGLVFLIS